jgi:hypothetical protein
MRPFCPLPCVAALAGCLLTLAPPSMAQEPAGSKFRVNTYTTGYQIHAAVASADNGDFVVVWMSQPTAGGPRYIMGQRYDARGFPLGAEFRVNSGDHGLYPDIAAGSAGDYVVVQQG